ncbi:MAG: ABC transporter ATP-binding protein [Alphaproteobacteria bacterium]|jgi:branched-chain amino acid transport system ATP-binding protein|nr:ABC transporter ATP-binding protein [Alphaproteobacteria bacterium]
MIRAEKVSMNFGGVRAVDNVSLNIAAGSITGLVGPNGAGKTTLFNVMAGTYAPSAGRIWLQQEDITGLPPHQLFHKGVLRTFQLAHEFSSLSVLDNLMMVSPHQSGERLFDALLASRKIQAEEEAARARAEDVIRFLGLERVRSEAAGNLSGGQKKLLELGRTMMVEAKIVLLDEVGAGVNRTLLKSIGEAILRLNQERGYTFCMIEHDMDFISRLCSTVIVMAEGAVLTQGTAEEIKQDSRVIDAYLGTGLKNRKGAR